MAALKNIVEGDDDKAAYKNKFYIVESNWFLFIPQNQLDSTIAPKFKLLQLSFNLTWKQQHTPNP
jgi:hypothetical protein